MNKEIIERLYKELIIPESIQPYRFEKRKGAHILAYNPVCGDKFRIYTNRDDICFHGHGCALSKASGSLLMRQLENRPFEEAKELVKQFISAVRTGSGGHLTDKSLMVLVELVNYDGREDCILLTWLTMLEYMESK